MMKFSIGYQLTAGDEPPFSSLASEFLPHVAEVYFAPPGMPSGRSPLPDDPASIERFEHDLLTLREMGIELNMLVNANCYGGLAMSTTLERCIVDELGRLESISGEADSVTTTSPAVATILKRHFPNVSVRASVNMRIGTIQAMEYLGDAFDGYYMQRDYNRDLEAVDTLHSWASSHGKSLHLLANSGCLRFCPAQTFHDNLVAHEPDVANEDNIPNYMPYACWNLLKKRENWPAVLQATWIRPEDLHHYKKWFSIVKLATRLHERPWVVVKAYAKGKFSGNLPDLFEPGFSRALAPYVVDNEKFPGDWFEKSCELRDDEDYHARVLEKVLVELK